MRDGMPKSELVGQDTIAQVRPNIINPAALEGILSKFKVDTVIHLAVQVIVGTANPKSVPTFEANVRGTWSLLKACRQSSLAKQPIVALSDSVCGDQADPRHIEQ